MHTKIFVDEICEWVMEVLEYFGAFLFLCMFKTLHYGGFEIGNIVG